MTYTKDIARHDRIWLDGVDVSNCFREFGLTSEHSEEDASGFSESGMDETLPGTTAQGFTGTAYYTPEFYALVWPLHINRTVVEVQWQPDGLRDPSREVYYADVTVNQFGPVATRGTVRTMPFAAKPATEAGITAAAAT